MKSFDDRPQLPLGTTDQNPLTVSQLTGQLKGLVEESFPGSDPISPSHVD